MSRGELSLWQRTQMHIEETRNAGIKIEAVRLEQEAMPLAGINDPFDGNVTGAQRIAHLLAMNQWHPPVIAPMSAIRHTSGTCFG